MASRIMSSLGNIAYGLHNLGLVAREEGDYVEARALLEGAWPYSGKRAAS